MQAVSPADKLRILDILCAAFDRNPSVNAITGSGPGRERRIRALMDYSFEICRRFGGVFLTPDRGACALVLYPDQKRFPAAQLLELRLIVRCVGPWRLPKVLRREARIKKGYPAAPFTYLWFIGTDPEQQGRGLGAVLLRQILDDSDSAQRAVYLETSVLSNTEWYSRHGFEVYDTLDFRYHLYCMRREPSASLPELDSV